MGEQIWIHKTAEIATSVSITAPAIICENSVIRRCALLRGSVPIGANCMIGNCVELKNVLLFNDVQLGHFNYVGDRILGCRVHLGAGAVVSNVRLDKAPVAVTLDGRINTNLRKLGAMVGDGVEIGSNCVINPGTIIGRHAVVYPLQSVRGYIAADSAVNFRNM